MGSGRSRHVGQPWHRFRFRGTPSEVETMRQKFVVTLTKGEDEYVVAECPGLPGCLSQGKTREEAIENIREAILLSLETRKAHNLPITVETEEVEVSV